MQDDIQENVAEEADVVEEKKKTPGMVEQNRALLLVKEKKALYKTLCSKRKAELKRIYKEVMSFQGDKKAAWSSTIKANFANQIENLVTSRLTAKNPRFIVSFRREPQKIADEIYGQETQENSAEREKVAEWTTYIQEYLNFVFEEYNRDQIKLAAKSLVRYGNVYGTVGYHHEIYRKKEDGKIVEKVSKEYPFMEIIPWSEIHIDPRYIQTADSPGVVWSHGKVRLSELLAQGDDLINVDKIQKVPGKDNGNPEKQEVYQIKINDASGEEKTETRFTLDVDKYFGYFSPTGEAKDESVYEIWTVADCLVVKYKEIVRNPVHSAVCFSDPEQHYGIGYVEPILGMQQEYNFKLNSQNEYINAALNRSWLWDPNSGIDPRVLRKGSAPGSLIPVTNGMDAAKNGLQELEMRPIPPEVFTTKNELRRDMQSLSFTIDTTAPSSQQGFTNTATAVRARFYESNVVYGDTLRNLEDFLVRMAYDMLDAIVENSSEDVIIARLGEGKFKFVKKPVFEDAPLRYTIRVEVGSSSFDNVESRREEAMAYWTIAKEAAGTGVSVNLEQVFKDITGTFEKKNPEDYLVRDMSPILGSAVSSRGQLPTPEPKANLDNPEALTKSIVQGNITP